MCALIVNLFGRFYIHRDGRTVDALNKHRAQELLGYLLLHRDRPYPREALATLLWEDISPDHAKKYLRQALWQIHTALPEPIGACKRLLDVEAEWIQLNADAEFDLDVAVFEQAFLACQGVPGPQLDTARKQALERAINLYRGDLLEGWYQDWCLFERERLQNAYLTMLDKLVAWCEAHKDIECGLAYAERILRHDPAREQTHYLVMRLHGLAGNRTRAIHQYHHCEKILMDELGVRPSERTKALYEFIRTDKLDAYTTDLPLPGMPNDAQSLDLDQLTGLLSYLERLQASLASVGIQLQQDIQVLQRTLGKLR